MDKRKIEKEVNGMYMELDPYYEDQLQYYDDVEDMCNQLGLNYDDVYDYCDEE